VDDGSHSETSQGGLAVLRGSNEIAVSMMDPDDWINTGGVRWLQQSNGSKASTPRYYLSFMADYIQPDVTKTFGKGASMGDLELLCDMAPVQIGNRVWEDLNANGIQDPGEPGIAGVRVVLEYPGVNGWYYGTAITDSDGRYFFNSNLSEARTGGATPDAYGAGLRIGYSHRVILDRAADFAVDGPLSGYSLTRRDATSAATQLDEYIDSDAIAESNTRWTITAPETSAGTSDLSLGFGVVKPVTISSLVWNDANADGIRDNSESGMPGAVLTLFDINGNPAKDINGQLVAPVVTDNNGSYSFTNLPATQYKIEITYPDGYGPTLVGQGNDTTRDSSAYQATTVKFTAGGQSENSLAFGVVPVVSVGDYVWYDSNHNGVQDASDIPLSGVRLTLTKSDGTPAYNSLGELVTTTTTSTQGVYTFDNLPFGQYTVHVTPPSGYLSTHEGNGSTATDSSTTSATSVVLNIAGQRDSSLDFGFWGEVSVGDYVWFDANNNGVQDATDVPLEGVLLSITKIDGSPAYNSSGELVTTTSTNAKGSYSFDNLQFGQYKVSVTPPPAYRAAKTGRGMSATDSSQNFATSVALSVNGQRDPTLDFGFVLKSRKIALQVIPNSSVGDQVWRDINGDGIKSRFDPGLQGITVSIFNTDGSRVTDVTGTLIQSTRTDARGKFLFDGLPPGRRYVVKVTYPSGWRPTSANRSGRARNSSSYRATSVTVQAGKSDLTLDFGVVTTRTKRNIPTTR